MAEIINWPGPGPSSHAARSGRSKRRGKAPHPSVVPFQSRARMTPEGFALSGTTSQPVDKAAQGLGPSRPGSPIWLKSGICPEALALRDSIMDDKSMQPWTSLQLTLPGAPRTIGVVGRPKIPTSPAAYRAQFFERVRTARKMYTDHPPVMAEALGIEKGTYYRYETRLMMPHHLIPAFCEITGVPMDWLMKGPDATRAAAPIRKVVGGDRS
jgi:hypothetical protein